MSPAWFFIINPLSGSGKAARLWPILSKALHAQGVNFSQVFTTSPKHATKLAADAHKQGLRHFIAVGGDGTVNEVVQGLFQQSSQLQDCYLGVIPWGTGNDWAALHGIPKAIKPWLALFLQPTFHAHDIGVAEFGTNFHQQHIFMNMLGAGFDSYLLHRMGAASGRRLKYYAYLLTGLKQYQSPRFHISQALLQSEHSLMIMACIGKFGGAGMKFAPDAAFDDGLLDVINITDMPFWQRLFSLGYLLNGKIKQHPKVLSLRCDSLSIEADKHFLFQCDGELIGALPVRASLQKQAIQVLSRY